MSSDLLNLVRELNTLNDDNLAERVIRDSDVQWCLSELQDILEAGRPTLTPPNEWVSVEEGLPKTDGWYLVYAPGYWGHSKIYGLDGLAYSNFKHNYKVHWGIERGTGRGYPGIVTHWMPLPERPERQEDT